MSFALRLVAFIIGLVGIGLWVLTQITGSLEPSSSVEFAAVMVLGLVGICILLIVLFGVRNLSFGKIKMRKIILTLIPLVAVVICLMLGSSLDPGNPMSAGALLAMFVCFALALVGIVMSAAKSLIGA